MNKKIVLISILVLVVLVVGTLMIKGSSSPSANKTEVPITETAITPASAPMSVVPADRIEVIHFHGTQQCVSCITVGKFALKTIQDKLPAEYASGKIVFKEINGELPENEAIVTKYQARGSSLFVNAIRGEKDEIAEDTTVWRLVNSEEQYLNYFEGKLKTLLGK